MGKKAKKCDYGLVCTCAFYWDGPRSYSPYVYFYSPGLSFDIFTNKDFKTEKAAEKEMQKMLTAAKAFAKEYGLEVEFQRVDL